MLLSVKVGEVLWSQEPIMQSISRRVTRGGNASGDSLVINTFFLSFSFSYFGPDSGRLGADVVLQRYVAL